jgi:multidrug efflux pump subunit AcrA (membrane-fusion protein)
MKLLIPLWAVGLGLCCCVFQNSVVAQESFVSKDAVLKMLESRDVPSKVSGVIRNSKIREGSAVEGGNLLMEVDSRLASFNVQKLTNEKEISAREAASTVELEFMKRSIDVAKAELSRALQSNNRLPGAVPQSEIDQLVLVAERAVAEKKKTAFDMQIKRMQTTVRDIELSIGQRQLSNHEIYAPISGNVVEVYKKQGEWVNASEPVAKVVQLNRLKAEIKVPASIALDSLVGTKAVFSPELESLKGQTFEGRVTFVNPEANPVNLQMRVWVEIENEKLKLVPGLVGSIELLRESGTKTEKEVSKR